MNNTDLQNNGALNASNATISITGSNNTSFSGSGTPLLQALTLNTSLLSAGNASAAKTAFPVQAVPLRKSDIAGTVEPVVTGVKVAESRLALPDSRQPPSFISAGQALELRQKQDGVRKPVQ